MSELLSQGDGTNAAFAVHLATPNDISVIDYLDSFSNSPTRDIHREMEKYFGSVDPSTHERTLIFLASLEETIVGKAELMIPPYTSTNATGYIKRVIVLPAYRSHGIARRLLHSVINYAQQEIHLAALDLHVWDQNHAAVHLYESLGFQLQHRELYFKLSL